MWVKYTLSRFSVFPRFFLLRRLVYTDHNSPQILTYDSPTYAVWCKNVPHGQRACPTFLRRTYGIANGDTVQGVMVIADSPYDQSAWVRFRVVARY